MDDRQGMVLPYRTDADDLHRLLTALARGRTPPQARMLGFSPKGFEGTVTAARALGLISDNSDAPTELGRRYVLAEGAQRVVVLREVLQGYAPYALLLEAVATGVRTAATPLDWVQTWWATHGFGSSESNRVEAAPVLARLVESAGLGRYVQGRKGHVSRIEWAADAGRLVAATAGPAGAPPAPRTGGPPATGSLSDASAPSPVAPEGEEPTTELRWELAPGRAVQLRLPGRLTPGERRRLRELFELLLGG